ncbi:hypothetical protein NDU88_003773 [Pleurodeles waltl]|uniref:Uncharacterized protein n=1 Tax=Pleurodeles waltl TaxID=8319 RepID=A0AAV7UZE8_PLEWA|nr:hypothetical protein NDU88_003773 [Pleurodeles waltl]
MRTSPSDPSVRVVLPCSLSASRTALTQKFLSGSSVGVPECSAPLRRTHCAQRRTQCGLPQAILPWVATGWLGARAPELMQRVKEVLEWGVAEEQQMCLSQSDEKALEDIEMWGSLLDSFTNHGGQDTDTELEEVET